MSTGREVLTAVADIEDRTERVYVAFVLAMMGAVTDDSVRLARDAWASMPDDEAVPWQLAVIVAQARAEGER